MQERQPERWNWKKMDTKGVVAIAAHIPLEMGLEDPGPQGLRTRIRTVEGLETAFNHLIQLLQGVAEATTPKNRANRGRASPWWDQGIQEACKEAREAERAHQRAPNEHTGETLQQACRAKTKAIGEGKTRAWRATVQRATEDSELL